MSDDPDCERCELAGRAEAIWWGGFMLGFAVGVGLVCLLIVFGWVKP